MTSNILSQYQMFPTKSIGSRNTIAFRKSISTLGIQKIRNKSLFLWNANFCIYSGFTDLS